MTSWYESVVPQLFSTNVTSEIAIVLLFFLRRTLNRPMNERFCFRNCQVGALSQCFTLLGFRVNFVPCWLTDRIISEFLEMIQIANIVVIQPIRKDYRGKAHLNTECYDFIASNYKTHLLFYSLNATCNSTTREFSFQEFSPTATFPFHMQSTNCGCPATACRSKSGFQSTQTPIATSKWSFRSRNKSHFFLFHSQL